MVTALALVFLVGWATLLAAALARVVDGLERRRLRRVAAQVRVTETVHHALGAVVAPTVTWHWGQPSTIRMGLGPRDVRLAGQLVELAGRALGPMGDRVRIVFTPRAPLGAPSNAWCPDDGTWEPAGGRRAEWAAAVPLRSYPREPAGCSILGEPPVAHC